MNLQQMIVKEVEGSAAERDVLLKVEGDRCEMDATSLKLFSVLVYIHLLFDVFSRSGAKESVPAGIAVGGGGDGGGVHVTRKTVPHRVSSVKLTVISRKNAERGTTWPPY